MARPDPVRSAVLDASALIGYIKGEPEFASLKSLLAAVDREEVTLVESTAILTEVLPPTTPTPSLTRIAGVPFGRSWRRRPRSCWWT